MIPRTRKTLALTAIAAIVAIAAVASIWWYNTIPTAERGLTLIKTKTIIIFGIISGGTLALLALGFTLIYGVAGVVDMAHGSFFMIGAYIFYVFTSPKYLELNIFLAFTIAVILTGVIGATVYRLTIHPVIEELTSLLVITVGVALVFERLMIIGFGPFMYPIPSFVGGYETIIGVKVTYTRLLAFAVSLILFTALWIFISKAKIGRAMRAAAQDQEAAKLMGVNTGRLFTLTMALSSILAAAAGILITASTSGVAMPFMWLQPLIVSFAVVILGGLGSIKGTLIGSFIIGFVQNIVVFLAPEGSYLSGAAAMAIMVAVLLVRPKGLFGKWQQHTSEEPIRALLCTY